MLRQTSGLRDAIRGQFEVYVAKAVVVGQLDHLLGQINNLRYFSKVIARHELVLCSLFSAGDAKGATLGVQSAHGSEQFAMPSNEKHCRLEDSHHGCWK